MSEGRRWSRTGGKSARPVHRAGSGMRLLASCEQLDRLTWFGSPATEQVAAGGGRIRRWPLEDWLCEAYNRGDPGQACGISPRASVSPSGVIHDSSIAITLGPRLLPSVPRFASGDSTGRPKRHLPSRLAAPLSFSQLSGSLLPRRPRRRRLRTRPTIARAPGRATRGAALSVGSAMAGLEPGPRMHPRFSGSIAFQPMTRADERLLPGLCRLTC